MRLLARVVPPAVLSLLLTASVSPALAQVTVERNVVYGMYSGLALLMPFYDTMAMAVYEGFEERVNRSLLP